MNAITQSIACVILKDTQVIHKNVERILIEKEYLLQKLGNIRGIKIYSSEANFVLIEVENAQKIIERLFEKGIDVRKFTSYTLQNCLRITVGSREENEYLLNSISWEN